MNHGKMTLPRKRRMWARSKRNRRWRRENEPCTDSFPTGQRSSAPAPKGAERGFAVNEPRPAREYRHPRVLILLFVKEHKKN